MANPNPYESFAADTRIPAGTPWQPRTRIWTCVSAAALAMIPLYVGISSYISYRAYTASLPPGQFVCGNAALGPLFCVVFITPIFAAIGAVTGSLAATIAGFWSKRFYELRS